MSALHQQFDDASIARDFESADLAIRNAALESAVQIYSQGLAKAIYGQFRNALNAHDLKEIVSKTFCKIWRKLQKRPWKVHTSLTGLLFKTGRWIALEFLRAQKRWRNRHTTIENLTAEELGSYDDLHPWDGLQRQEQVAEFARCVSRLPGLQRAVGEILVRHFATSDNLPSKHEIVAELARNGCTTTEASLKSCLQEITRKFLLLKKRHEQQPAQQKFA